MPTYEYECTKCGHTFDAFHSIKDAPLSSCPKCRGKLRRLIGGGMGVIFKGSGFYTTDYKRSSALTGSNGKSKEKETGTAASKPAESGTGSAKAEKAPAT
jgi:putative FmdB family regulatory protein